MYRWLSVFTCLLGIALIAADAPPPVLVPAGPSVVVFAFVPSGTATGDAGVRIATALAAKLATGGKVAARLAPAGTAQSDYLSAARTAGADYYVSGFVSGLGGGFSAALQVVTTRNGIAVWAGTTTLGAIDDVEGAASVVGVVIVNHAQRSVSAFGSSGSSSSGSGGSSGPARPVATKAPVAAEPAPRKVGRTVAVLDAIGSVTGTQADFVADGLAVALAKRGMVAVRWHRKQPQLDLGADLLCDETKTSLLVLPTVASQVEESGSGEWTTVTLNVAGYDCEQKGLLAQRSGKFSNWNWRFATEHVTVAVADQFVGLKGVGR